MRSAVVWTRIICLKPKSCILISPTALPLPCTDTRDVNTGGPRAEGTSNFFFLKEI